MPEKKIKEMLKKPGIYAFEVNKNLKVKVVDLNRTYSFMVDKNFDTKEVYDNGVKLKPAPVTNPKHKPREPEEMHSLPAKLKPGCIGLVALVSDQSDQCIYKWGHWF
jgi:hypothetical protein